MGAFLIGILQIFVITKSKNLYVGGEKRIAIASGTVWEKGFWTCLATEKWRDGVMEKDEEEEYTGSIKYCFCINRRDWNLDGYFYHGFFSV